MAPAILIVEDERIVTRDMQRTLSDLGCSVPDTAASSDQALQCVSQSRPDLVLMDIRSKGDRYGIETAAMIQEHNDVPVVYVTAYADGATVDRAKKTNPFGYLLKPIKANELRSNSSR